MRSLIRGPQVGNSDLGKRLASIHSAAGFTQAKVAAELVEGRA